MRYGLVPLFLFIVCGGLACDNESPPQPIDEVKRPKVAGAPTPEPAPRVQTVMHQAPKPHVVEVEPPSQGPVVAIIDGETVEGFRAWYSQGVLTLYTGEDPWFEFGRKISFWHVPREPAGQRILQPVPAGEIGYGNLSYEKHDPDRNTGTEWLEDFRYELRIGHEDDFKVEVALSGRGSGPADVRINGTVTAMTAGIKMEDGVVDRSFDHLDTIQYLTRSWIEERHRPQTIAERPDHCMMEKAAKKTSKPPRLVAACSYLYTDEYGESAIAKLWLEKKDGAWTETGELAAHELFPANPIKPVRNATPWLFKPIAAQRFQDTVYAERGGFRRISESGRFSCGSAGKEAGWCELTYAVYAADRTPDGDGERACEVVTYVFGQNASGEWVIDRTLDTGEKFNRKTREVEPREQVPQHCS